MRTRLLRSIAVAAIVGALFAAAPGVEAQSRAPPRKPASSKGEPNAAKKTVRARAARANAARQRAETFRRDLSSAGLGTLARALRSFGDVNMPAGERRRLLAQASKEPLTDVTVVFLRAVSQAVPPGGFERAAAELDRRHPQASKLGSESWWGSIVPKELPGTGRALDSFARSAQRPEFRAQVDRALDVLRVAGRVEAEALSQIAVHVPPGEMPRVRQALARYGADVARLVLTETRQRALSPAERKALDGLVTDMIAFGEAALDPDPGLRARDLALAGALGRIQQNATIAAETARSAMDDPQRLARTDFPRLAKRLAVHNRRLVRVLSSATRTTPQSRKAVRGIARDLELAGRFSIGLAQIAGAAHNRDMPAEQRAQTIKSAAESMGPIFIKSVQTAINQPGALEALGFDGASGDEAVLMALSSLQNRVTPMSMAAVRSQVRRDLGKDLDDLFESFDPEPLASASIGQVHRARIRVKPTRLAKPELMDVAVKVQRVGLERELGESVRATRLALSMIREANKVFEPQLRARFDGYDASRIDKFVDFMESTVENFLRSFEVETDFRNEARQMRRFASSMAGAPHVYVPAVYGQHSGARILTMEYVRGDMIGSYASRVSRAEAARAEPMPEGPLPGRGGGAEALRRARHLAVRAYGLDPVGARAERTRRGWAVTVRFDHPTQRRAVIDVGRDGSVSARGAVPDLSPRGALQLRDRLFANFVNQSLLKRFVHGDLHQGNFAILPDGRTVVIYDYGQMVELDRRHFLAPAEFALGLWQNRPGLMADALVRMSEQHAAMSRAEHRRVAARVKAEIESVLSEHDDHLSQEAISGILMKGSAKSGLTLSSTYLQWIKTTFAMHGNLSALGNIAGDGGSLVRSAPRVGAEFAREAALSTAPVAQAVQTLKRRRVLRMLREAQGD